MAERDIVQSLIAALGQSQSDRDARALAPGSAPPHLSDAAAMLVHAHALAQRLRFHSAGGAPADAPDWTPFFGALGVDEAHALLARSDGGVAPHLALYAAFAQLFDRHARHALNGFTARHLEFQWRSVLGFAPRPPQPDRALVTVELKKGAAPLVLGVEQAFLAGKDGKGRPLRYRPVRETHVSHARIVSLCAQHRDAAGRVFAAPEAASADGLGAPLTPAAPAWSAFGPPTGTRWPSAGVGFAIASPLLALAEGERDVELWLRLADTLPASVAARLPAAFEASYSTPSGWSAALPIDARAQGPTQIVCRLRLPPEAPGCVSADPALHGAAWSLTSLPVLRCRLGAEASIDGLDDLQPVAVTLTVRVRGISAGLALENDAGTLDPKRAFQPFGAQPVAGSRFMVGCPEALAKPLVSLALRLTWQGAPADLESHYAHYSNATRLRNGVTATLIFADGQGRSARRVQDLMARDAQGVSTLTPDAPPPASIWTLHDKAVFGGLARMNNGPARHLLHSLRLRLGGDASPLVAPAVARAGFITVQLNEDFLHADHRREAVAGLLANPKLVLNEPYAPTVASIALDYEARSPEVALAAGPDEAADAAAYTGAPLQFFHVGAFGARREHPWLRRAQPGSGLSLSLVPRTPHEGELFIGVAGVGPGDPLSLMVQVASGSGDPELAPPRLEWSVLSGDQWRALAPEAIAHEGTRGMLVSGTVALALPAETSTRHAWMPDTAPDGMAWLRVAATSNSRAACALLALAGNGVELCFDNLGNDPQHATQALPAGRITKLAAPLAALKSVTQPYASFGARQAEDAARLSGRAAERLRHRDRALAAWDIERLVLGAFPSLHRVKCLPHARPGQWLAPGRLTVVVVPRVGADAASAADRLRPRADLGTLDAVREFVACRAALGAQVTAKNPFFEALRVDFKLHPRAGVAFNPLRAELDAVLRRALAPWAFDAEREIGFGGQVFRSALLALVESQPGVDFVTEFKLQAQSEDGRWGADSAALQASRPDAVLVSASSHVIVET